MVSVYPHARLRIWAERGLLGSRRLAPTGPYRLLQHESIHATGSPVVSNVSNVMFVLLTFLKMSDRRPAAMAGARECRLLAGGPGASSAGVGQPGSLDGRTVIWQ